MILSVSHGFSLFTCVKVLKRFLGLDIVIYSSKMYAMVGGDKHLGDHLNSVILVAIKIGDSCQAGARRFSIVQLLKSRLTKRQREYVKIPFVLTLIICGSTLRRRNVCINNLGEITFPQAVDEQ